MITTPKSEHSLPGPENITRAELPNGITILSRSNFNSPSVLISGYLACGSLFDPDEKLGLADFTASALMRGAGDRSFQQIYEALEAAGASLNIGGGTHTVSFSGKALAEDLDLLISLLADALRRPHFPEDQVEKLRAQMLTGLAIRAQDTGDRASLAFDQIVYAGHPYSRPEDGWPETIQAISRDDLAGFHRRHYGPLEMKLTIVGAVGPLRAVEKLAAAFGDWQNPQQPPLPALPPLATLTEAQVKRVEIPGKAQADLVIGAAGPERRSPDFMPAAIGNNILGQFGMMGRVGEAVREKAGLAYYAHSSLGGGSGPGPWDVSAGVAPEDADQAVELILQEIERFTREPVSPEELADSQASFIGSLPLSLESNAGVAAALIRLERYELGLDFYLRYPDLIREVTREAVLATAQRYLDPQRLAVALAGSFNHLEED